MEINKIPEHILGAVRQRFGSVDENDTQFDIRISNLDEIELIAKYTGWVLGDESLGRMIISYYNELKDLNTQMQKHFGDKLIKKEGVE